MPRAAAAPSQPEPSAVVDPARLAALHSSGLLDTLPSESFDRFTRLAVRLLGVPVAMVSLVDADRQVLLSATGLEGLKTEKRETLAYTLCRHVVDRDAPLVIEDARNVAPLSDTTASEDVDVIAYAGMPLTNQDGHTFGSLCAIDSVPRRWSEGDLDALAELAATVMAELELRSLAASLNAEARKDLLTGLGNRRMWDDEAPRAIARARRLEQPLVLALLDLDRFKKFNDRHGHHAGDELLREITESWQSSLGAADALIRMGGLEFAVLVPDKSLDQAFDVVEQLRQLLTSGITCSAGLAMAREDETADTLLARADAGLSRAKRSRRGASAMA